MQEDGTIRITLLRSPYYSHHDPLEIPQTSSYSITNQGVHDYCITLIPSADADMIRNEITVQQEPVVVSESTHGMKPH
jgi:hypothetical protein